MSKINTFQNLLQKQLERFEIALELERKKQIVFPETGQIVNSIISLEEKIKKQELEDVVIKSKKSLGDLTL